MLLSEDVRLSRPPSRTRDDDLPEVARTLATRGVVMYIGGGAVLILVIIVVVLLLRR
jgi:hypothetical protein